MFQILLLLIFILVSILGGFLFFFPGQKHQDLTEIEESSTSQKVLGQQKIEEEGKELVVETKDTLKDQVQGVADQVNQYIEQKVSEVLGDKKDQSLEVEIALVETDIKVEADQTINFDLNTDRNKKLNLKKGTKYLMNFSSIPDDSCLYIGDKEYPLNESKKILLSFQSSGNFPLKMDFCSNFQKDLGEFVVN